MSSLSRWSSGVWSPGRPRGYAELAQEAHGGCGCVREPTARRVDGPTPAGGAYSICFYSYDGRPVSPRFANHPYPALVLKAIGLT